MANITFEIEQDSYIATFEVLFYTKHEVLPNVFRFELVEKFTVEREVIIQADGYQYDASDFAKTLIKDEELEDYEIKCYDPYWAQIFTSTGKITIEQLFD